MSEKNIWEGLNFNDTNSKSVFEYLSSQSIFLEKATESELKMEVEGVDAYLDEEPIKLVGLYKLFVVAPRLGNFRRKILTVVEGKYGPRFPVDIFCHVDDVKDEKISEEHFLEKVNEILQRKPVQFSIINLYKQSKEAL